MKKKLNWMLMFTIVMAASVFTACGGDSDDDNGSGTGNGLTGWYINRPSLYTSNDFTEDVTSASTAAILFHDNGLYWPDWSSIPTGNPDGSINLRMEYHGPDVDFIRIADSNTLYYYENPSIYKQGTSGSASYELLYQVDGGSYGKLGFYGTPVRYNYTRNGNEIILSQGNERASFTITSGGLENEDWAEPIRTKYWTKYNPNTVY